jgi:multidrug resistance efflux pump
MNKTIRIASLIGLVIFAWYLMADRQTPFTGNARVKAVVVPVVPQVSGYLTAISVSNGSVVAPGQVLAIVDPEPYQIAVDKARADLESAASDVGASSAEVELAQSGVSRAQINLENVQVQTARVFELEKKGLVAVARGDDARSALAAAQSELAGAEADLVRAQEKLGQTGADNPRIQAAVANLAKAELDLRRTELVAPSAGVVVDLVVAQGAYASPGKPVLTFISVDDVWIEAYLTENNLGNLNVGDPVEVTLDMHPGRVLKGIVTSNGYAASSGRDTKPGELTNPPKASGWMRDPQRFPVRIQLPEHRGDDPTDDVRYRMNGQADVIVYTGGNFVLNAIGAVWIRVMAFLSYAY